MAGKKVLNIQIEGGRKLSGSMKVNTSKNGAVALLCASLLNKNKTVLHDVPRIEEVHRLIETLKSIGTRVVWKKNSLYITPPKKFLLSKLNTGSAQMTRSIIMFIGPLLHELNSFSLPQSGGCRLGERTVRPHFFALEKLGVSIETTKNSWKIMRGKNLKKNQEIVMYESGDTATENAILAAARIPGKTTIKYASANYQVQELCFFLESLGVRVEGIGTTTLTIFGLQGIDTPVEYFLSEDPIDAMLYIATAAVTKSKITIKGCPIEFVEKELLVLSKMGFKYKVRKHYTAKNGRTKLVDIVTFPSRLLATEDKIHAQPYPGLNMDNLPFFAVIATQAEGTTLIHDWVYEKRAIYYTELDKLGANTMLADPHRIYIHGPTKLKSAELICPPALRPATIILIGMLGAKGTSVLRNIYSINRGYEDVVKKLNTLGAKILIVK